MSKNNTRGADHLERSNGTPVRAAVDRDLACPRIAQHPTPAPHRWQPHRVRVALAPLPLAVTGHNAVSGRRVLVTLPKA